MRKIYFNIAIGITLIGGIHYVGAQENDYHPYKKFGGDHVQMLTLSNGKYNEFFDTDSIEIVGAAILNTNTMKVIGFVEPDTLYSEATLEPEVVSRFLSIDPLAAEYPYNSPYAFSENVVISHVELEGLEKFFAANGNYIGSIDGSQKIRVVNEADVDYAKTVLNNQKMFGIEVSFLNRKSKSLTDVAGDNGYIGESGAELMGMIYDYIFKEIWGEESINNLKEKKVKLLDSQFNVVRGEPNTVEEKQRFARIGGFNATVIEGNIYVLTPFTNNYYDIAMTLYHEYTHEVGGNMYGAGAWGEFNTHYKVSQHDDYAKSSEGYQEWNMRKLGEYLEQQETFVNDNPDNKRAKKIYEKNKSLYEGLQDNESENGN